MEPTSPPKNGKRKASELEGEDIGGWVYVGSHNFSSAAWVSQPLSSHPYTERLSQGTANLKKKLPTLNVRNYELGIVFPLRPSYCLAVSSGANL